MENKKSKKDLIVSLVIFVALIGYFFIKHWDSASSWAIALLGFGFIIFIHELGHFLVARKCDIDCEAFSIGMAIGTPYLFSFKKVAGGLRVRLLPKTSGLRENFADDCLCVFTIPFNFKKDSDTEYCLGPLPIGGFVKMKGQDDSGPVDAEKDNDPRSFVNKTVGKRMAVVSAGVIFNIIGAFLLFACLARYGVDKVPAIVGGVVDGSPAQVAGLEAGDQILAINGKSMEVGGRSNLDYTHIILSAILSGDEPSVMEVQKASGDIKDIEITPKKVGNEKVYGIYKPKVLKVADFGDEQAYYDRVGLQAGDEIFAVDGNPVDNYNQYREYLKDVYAPYITFSAKRLTNDPDKIEAITSRFKLAYSVSIGNAYTGSEGLANIYSIVPPLKIEAGLSVYDPVSDMPEKLEESTFVRGDVIFKAGDVDFPTFSELNEIVSQHDDKPLAMEVLRELDGELKVVQLTVTPTRHEKGAEPKIGILPMLDLTTPIIAGTYSNDENYPALDLPKGAVIKAVNGVAVDNYFDIINQLENQELAEMSLTLELADSSEKTVSVALNSGKRLNLAKDLQEPEPFDDLRVKFKGENVFEAVQLGTFWVGDMLGQSVGTIKGLFQKKVGADMLSGPIGIARLSHRIVQSRDFGFFLYFMGMISCFLAVMNFLPIPVVDGGVFLLLVIEKIKGSPVSYKVQKILIYAGLAMIGALFVLVIFNDVMNIIKGG